MLVQICPGRCDPGLLLAAWVVGTVVGSRHGAILVRTLAIQVCDRPLFCGVGDDEEVPFLRIRPRRCLNGDLDRLFDELRVEATQEGRRIDVEVKRPSRESTVFGINVSTSAKLIVSVPKHSAVLARTGDGAIRIEGVEGKLELRSGDGSIHVSEVKGELVLNTGDGSINVDHAEGRLTLETGDGGVNVEGNLSVVRMHTGDGSIVYRADSATRMEDDWDISTGDGSVSIYLPAGFNADLDAHTGDGRIRNELGIAADRNVERDHDSDERDRRTLRGKIGEGGKRLRVQTGDGGITLRAR